MGRLDHYMLRGIFVIFGVMILVLLISGFLNLQDTNRAVEDTLGDIREHMETAVKKELDPVEESHLARIEYVSKRGLDNSTNSFLLQILWMSLCSAGVYMLTQSQKKYAEAERMVAELRAESRKSIEIGFQIQKLGEGLSSTQISSRLMRASPGQPTMAVAWEAFTLLRDLFRDATDTLRNANQQHRNLLRDQAKRIQTDLKQVPDDELDEVSQGWLRSMRGIIEECIAKIEKANRKAKPGA